MAIEQHVTDLIPAHALGCLDREEEILVSEHLAGCALCREELEAYQRVVDQLPLAAPEVAPSLDLKGRLMDRVQPTPASSTSREQEPWWKGFFRIWRRVAPAWGVISLVLIIALLASNINLRGKAEGDGVSEAGMRAVTLYPTDAAPEATGTLILSIDGEHGTLVVDGLPPLDEAYQYQLWLIKDGQRTSGGLLSVNRDGYGALWVKAPEPLASYPSFGMTVEPEGGSPRPTGEKVLGSPL
jgi:anti-sigma-K factor RskA